MEGWSRWLKVAHIITLPPSPPPQTHTRTSETVCLFFRQKRSVNLFPEYVKICQPKILLTLHKVCILLTLKHCGNFVCKIWPLAIFFQNFGQERWLVIDVIDKFRHWRHSGFSLVCWWFTFVRGYRGKQNLINPFVLNVTFFYPQKISENFTVFWCFQGVKKGCVGNKWVNWLKSAWY